MKPCLKIKRNDTLTPPEPGLIKVGSSLHDHVDHQKVEDEHQASQDVEHQASHPSCQLALPHPTGDAQKQPWRASLARQRPRNGTFVN